MPDPATPPNLQRVRTLTAHCRRCRHPVGEYVEDGKAFKRDGANGQPAIIIRQRLTFFCACGGRNNFFPKSA